jgi:hypothetical protein
MGRAFNVTLTRSYEDIVDGLVLTARASYLPAFAGRRGRDPDDSEPPHGEEVEVLEIVREDGSPVSDADWKAWGLDPALVRREFEQDDVALADAIEYEAGRREDAREAAWEAKREMREERLRG